MTASFANKVFLAQLKTHCIKYAEKHRVVKTGMLKLLEFFEGCHDADVFSRKYARVMDGKKKAKEQTKAKSISHHDRDRYVD